MIQMNHYVTKTLTSLPKSTSQSNARRSSAYVYNGLPLKAILWFDYFHPICKSNDGEVAHDVFVPARDDIRRPGSDQCVDPNALLLKLQFKRTARITARD